MGKYNWETIQTSYDNGMSWRDLEREYGVTQQALANAKKRGALVTSRTNSEAQLIRHASGKSTPCVHNPTFLENLSIKQSLNNSGGRCKWFEVSGIKVQGTWERNVAEKFNELNIKWEKVKTYPFEYIKDGKVKRYSPDFYLPEYDVYLEIKGYWWGNDREKMDLVIKQNPNVKIVIVEKDDYKRILQGELVWSFQRLPEEQ